MPINKSLSCSKPIWAFFLSKVLHQVHNVSLSTVAALIHFKHLNKGFLP